MTTLKPHLIRADTIDLQSQDAPSAKDHTRQPTHPAPLGLGPPAPHQNQALRHAEHESKQEQRFSPQVSPRPSEEILRNGYPDEPEFYDDQDESDQHEPHAPHGNLVGDSDHDSGVEMDETGDPSDDDSLNEDLMDKISSSPSIDDGKYTLPVIWPPRRDSLESGTSPSPSSTPTRRKQSSSSPFTSTPEHFPQILNFQKPPHPDSHQGEYAGAGKRCTMDPTVGDEALGCSPPGTQSIWRQQDKATPVDDHQFDFDAQNVGRFLPDDDSLLDNSFADADTSPDILFEDDGDPEWEDEHASGLCRIESCSSDDSENFQFTSDSRFIDSGWGGECLREIEDIDFEFVYALHTFVATVEGQANATKGDTMVLLDDSNSYWWLVRVVKDGSIGYLPAEHIETPTERLARLNKHRNIDLSATMLGDNPEKSKNPLKKAMRRRNAKTVQFAAPQFFEPSDFDYSEEEEVHDSEVPPVESEQKEMDDLAPEASDTVAVAPLRINTQTGPGANGVRQVLSNESLNGERQMSPEKSTAPEDSAAGEVVDEAALRSRNGVVRNTDSFYKDDSVETKKISLTPRLLRGDSDGNVQQEQPDMRQRPSLETFDQMIADDGGKSKDDKKKKDKKPGMLSGLFKRKDKKAKPGEPETEAIEKVSSEDSATKISPSSRESQDSLPGRGGPQRQISKLQKPVPGKGPSKTSPVQDNFRETLSPTAADRRDPSSTPGLVPQPAFGKSSTSESAVSQGSSGATHTHDKSATSPTSPTEKKSFFSPLSNALKSAPSSASMDEPVIKAVYAKKAKHRFEIDAADSEDESTPTAEVKHMRSTSPLQSEEERQPSPEAEADEEETVVPPFEAYQAPIPSPPREAPPPPPNEPPALQMDNSSNEEPPSMSPPSPSRSSSPSLVDVDTAHEGDQSTAPTTMSPQNGPHTPSISTARSTPTWSDASLRSYMDNDQGIRDLLLIVHDKSNVVPAGPDHPITGHLFSAEKTRLTEMQNNLDSMLTQWLARKNSTLLSG